MSTHNICLHGEKSTMLYGYHLQSGAKDSKRKIQIHLLQSGNKFPLLSHLLLCAIIEQLNTLILEWHPAQDLFRKCPTLYVNRCINNFLRAFLREKRMYTP